MVETYDFRELLSDESQEIDVSIYILTYFHEKYISQALDSVLNQKTKYKYEIVVSDDNSTDGTMDILTQYKNKYPDIIRINHNDVNLGIPGNIYKARCMCRGRYIVNLAGDDYWINDNKIQEEVSFLDKHPEYFVLCSRVELRYDDEITPVEIMPVQKETNKEFLMRDYEKGKNFNCHGLMMRNVFRTQKGREYFGIAHSISEKVDDAVDNLLMLRIGRVYTLDLITDVYRIPSNKSAMSNYNSRYSNLEKTTHEITLYNGMYKVFGEKVNFKTRYKQTVAVLIVRMIRDRNISDYMKLFHSIPGEYLSPIYKNIFLGSLLTAFKLMIYRIFRRKGK